MSDVATRSEVSPFPSAGRFGLRERIGWICHGLRIAAVVWIGWVTVRNLVYWSDKAALLKAYGQRLGLDISDVSNARYSATLALVLLTCGSGLAVTVCIWKLVGTYLAGRVFTVDAAVWLRRTGIAGIVAVVIDVVARLLVTVILAGQLMPVPSRGFFVLPQDLLHLIFAIFVLALAHIFKAAAEMADDHAQIV
jgi:Protein of unknown function (DUF2975)